MVIDVMASEWRLTKLGSEVDLLTGYPFKSDEYIVDSHGIALLRGDNIVQGQLRWDNAKRWSRTKLEDLELYFLEPGDVVLAMDRPWIEAGLKYAAISHYDIPSLLVQRVARLRAKNSLNRRFLKYVIGSAAFTNHILGIQTGTAVPHISGSQIKSFEFLCPPLPIQREIAYILGTLDDKIDLNRRMNATLEATARALFQSWFVDFDPVRAKAEGRQPEGMDAETAALFPDSFEDSALGEIPRGWRVGVIGDTASIFSSSVNPLKSPNELFWHYSLPAFDEGRMPKLEFGAAIKSNKNLVHEDAVLLSKLNPQHLKVWVPMPYHDYRSLASTEFLPVIGRNGISREYLYGLFNSELFLRVYANLVTGTSSSHQRVKPEYLLGMHIVIPSLSVIKRFTDMTKRFHLQVITKQEESRTLAEMRDALLPKLISGEVRVGDVEDVEAL